MPIQKILFNNLLICIKELVIFIFHFDGVSFLVAI